MITGIIGTIIVSQTVRGLSIKQSKLSRCTLELCQPDPFLLHKLFSHYRPCSQLKLNVIVLRFPISMLLIISSRQVIIGAYNIVLDQSDRENLQLYLEIILKQIN